MRNLPFRSIAKSCAPKPEQGERERAQSRKEILGSKRTTYSREQRENSSQQMEWTLTESRQLPVEPQAPAPPAKLPVRLGRAAARRRTEKVRERWRPLSCDSTVSWQKEAGTSDRITSQIGCWSMAAGEATVPSSRREVSVTQASWNRTSQALEKPGGAQEIQWCRHVGLNKSKATKEMCFNEVRLFRGNVPGPIQKRLVS